MKKDKTAALLLALMLAGCGASNQEAPSSEPEKQEEVTKPVITENEQTAEIPSIKNETVPVYDKDGSKLGEIHRYGLTTLTDEGIFYRALPPGTDDSGKKYEYRLFDTESGEDRLIGTVENVDYDVGYDRIELDGCIYELLITGNLMDDEPEVQHLYKFDLKNGKAEDVHSVEGMIGPYTSMCELNGKLLLCESIKDIQSGAWTDDLIEYDPVSGSSRKVMSFELASFSGGEQPGQSTQGYVPGLRGDAVRHISSDSEHFYVLRVSFADDGARLMLDTYDRGYKKLSEDDLSGFIVQSCDMNGMAQEDFDNELRQAVDAFEVFGGRYVYYENFSITRFFGDLETGKLVSEDINGNIGISIGGGKKFWCFMGDGGVPMGEEPRIGTLQLEDGKLTETRYKDAEDERYQIWNASSSPNGSRMLELYYKSPTDSNDILPTKFCLI